jgi:hypothetical protein
MIVCRWPQFGELCNFRGGDVDCRRQFLWSEVVHPPHEQDVISQLYMQGDFDSCRADCSLYHCQHSHQNYFCGLHLFNWFLRGFRKVHLYPFQFL